MRQGHKCQLRGQPEAEEDASDHDVDMKDMKCYLTMMQIKWLKVHIILFINQMFNLHDDDERATKVAKMMYLMDYILIQI